MDKLTEIRLQEIFETISRLSDDCAYEIEVEENIDITKAKINIKLERIEGEICKINDWIKGEDE